MLITPATERVRRQIIANVRAATWRHDNRRQYTASHPCGQCGGPIRDCTVGKAESRRTCSRSCGSTAKWKQRRALGLTQGCLNNYGYRVVRDKGRQTVEHRVVMEKMLGRPLLRSESVHHINGKKDDNRPGNLELWHKAHPAGVRVSDKPNHCPTCTCHVRVGEEK